MKKPIHVHILGREYTLRVEQEAESDMRTLAATLDERMRAFRKTHPTQPEVTAAVITALALAEELHSLRNAVDDRRQTIDALSERLERAMA